MEKAIPNIYIYSDKRIYGNNTNHTNVHHMIKRYEGFFVKRKICSKNRIKRENTNCGNKTLVYKDKNKYFISASKEQLKNVVS